MKIHLNLQVIREKQIRVAIFEFVYKLDSQFSLLKSTSVVLSG